MISKNRKNLFIVVFGRSTSILYQVQYINASNESTFVTKTASSIYLWHYQIRYLSSRIIDLILYNQAVNKLKIGDIYKTTVSYFPKQNRIVEYTIAIFFEMVYYMLWSTNVDLRHWNEAFMYTIHIRSLIFTFRSKNVVYYKTWTGHKPNVSYLCIFGSLGWVYIPK